MRIIFITLFPVFLFAFGVDMKALKEAIIEVESAKNPYAFCVTESDAVKKHELREYLGSINVKYKTKVSDSGRTIFSILPKNKITAVQIVNFLYDNHYKNYDVGIMQINRANFKKHPVYYLDREVNVNAGLDIVRRCYSYYLKQNAYEKQMYGQDQFVVRNLIRALECYKYGARDSFDSFENATKVIARYNKKLSSR